MLPKCVQSHVLIADSLVIDTEIVQRLSALYSVTYVGNWVTEKVLVLMTLDAIIANAEVTKVKNVYIHVKDVVQLIMLGWIVQILSMIFH